MDGKLDSRKRTRKTITLIKQRIIKDYEAGARVKDLAEKYNYAQITMARLLGNKQKLRKLENNTLIMEMEKMLFEWIKAKQKRKEPVSDTAIIQKAIELYDTLLKETPNASAIEGFRAHEGWFNRFCRQTGIEIEKVTRLVKKDLNEIEGIGTTSECGTSTSEDSPVTRRGIVDEIDNAVKSSGEVTDPSNSIYIQETYKETKDCPPHNILNCTEYLNNNDNIESEFDNSVSNEHIENIRDSSTLLSNLPLSRTHIENMRENSTSLRATPTPPTRTSIKSNIKNNSTLLRTVPTPTLTYKKSNINDNSMLLPTVPTETHCHNSVDTFSEKNLHSENELEDEFEVFGKYVAMSLRKMPLSNALSVENQIYSVINTERRLILRNNNKNRINIEEDIKMEVEEEPI